MRFVSPASTPDRADVAYGARMMDGWGLKVEIANHAFDRTGHFWPAGMLTGLPTSMMRCGIHSEGCRRRSGNGNFDGRKSEYARTTCRTDMPQLRGVDSIDRSSRYLDRSNRWNTDTTSSIGMSGWIEGAVGQFIRSAEPKAGKWSVIDVLYEPTGRAWCAHSRWAANWAWSAPAYRATWNDGNAGHNGWHSYD